MKTDEEVIAEVAELDAKATKGDWSVSTNRHPTTDGEDWGGMEAFPHPAGGCGSPPTGMGRITWAGAKGRGNAHFIAAARTLLPDLAARLQKSNERVKELEKALRDLVGTFPQFANLIPELNTARHILSKKPTT